MRSRTCVLLALLSLQGCYLSRELSGEGLPDGGRADGSVSQDGAIRMDASTSEPDASGGVDAGALDASGSDSGLDAGVAPGIDAEPPEPTHPDPTTCRIVPVIAPFDGAVLERRWPENGGDLADPGSVHVCATPAIIDLTPNDGEDLRPVVIFVSYDSLGRFEHGLLRIWDPAAETTITYPASSSVDGPFGPLEPSTNVAVGDLDGDGFVEIVAIGTDSGTYAFRHDGTLLWESPYPSAVERGTRFARTIGGAVTLADLENDGSVEVVVGRSVLDGRTGALRWQGDPTSTTRGANGSLGPIACTYDLDGDGIEEVISGRTAFRADGTVLWQNTVPGDGLCAVADMIATAPGPEVVLASNGYLYILDGQTGETLWDRVIEGRGRDPLGGPPTVADFDGDGRAEIGVAHGTSYGVYDLDCTGTGTEAGCAGPGVRWTTPSEDDSSAATGSSVFDFNGDGRAEVIYNDQYNFRIFDGTTGTILFEQANSSRTRTEYPVVADVDADGDAEIVFSANSEAFFLRPRTTDPGVEIWGDARGRWVGARRVWNQHAYRITNVDERGRVRGSDPTSTPTLNVYRQNLREGGDVLVVPDLWGGRGSYACVAAGTARVRVTVQNWGLERVGSGVQVRVFRGRPELGDQAGEGRTVDILPPEGGSEDVFIDVPVDATNVVDYWAVVDAPDEATPSAGGAVAECREDNNEVLIWRPACP